MTGWLPVFDTMHGIRGEVNIVVKVELFLDFNKFRQSSCGITFFYCKYSFIKMSSRFLHRFFMTNDLQLLLCHMVIMPKLYMDLLKN